MDNNKAISISISSPDVVEILKSLKGGVTKKFVVETALRKLYEDEDAKKMLFNELNGSSKEKVNNSPAVEAKEEKVKPSTAKEEKAVKKFSFD